MKVYILITRYHDGTYDCELFDERPTFDIPREIKTSTMSDLMQLRVGNINGGDSQLLEHAEYKLDHYTQKEFED